MTSGRRVRCPSVALLILAAVCLCSGWVGAASSDEITLQPGTPAFTPGGTSQLFIHLANDSTRQGLQLDLTYDPRVLQVVGVAPLGRLQAPQLNHSVFPVRTLHLLAYDGSPNRISIGMGSDAVAVVTFAVSDTVHQDTTYVSVGDALAASESLVPIPIAPQTIAIPLDAVTGTLVSLFTATPIENGLVRIQWELSSPSLSVNIYRTFFGEGERTALTVDPIAGPGLHTILDQPPIHGGTLVYELVSRGPSGESPLARLELAWGDAPAHFALYHTAPTPFSSSAVIRFDVPHKARVRIAIYDIAGRLVRTLQDGDLAPGRYSRRWDGRGDHGAQLSDGVYLFVAQMGTERIVRKTIRLN